MDKETSANLIQQEMHFSSGPIHKTVDVHEPEHSAELKGRKAGNCKTHGRLQVSGSYPTGEKTTWLLHVLYLLPKHCLFEKNNEAAALQHSA